MPGSLSAIAACSTWLGRDEFFEIQIDQIDAKLCGSLRFGVTAQAPEDEIKTCPGLHHLKALTVWVEGHQVKQNGVVRRHNFCTDLGKLKVGSQLGVRRANGSTIKFFINGKDFGVLYSGGESRMWPVVELFGSTEAVTIISTSRHQHALRTTPNNESPGSANNILEDSLEGLDKPSNSEAREPFSFHDNYGRNIRLSDAQQTAKRCESYNQGIVCSSRPLACGDTFSVTLEALNENWTSTLSLGILTQSPSKLHFPPSALGLKKHCHLVCGEFVYQNGVRIPGARLQPGLYPTFLTVKKSVGVMLDSSRQVRGSNLANG